jgi:AraC family transcriptional regulator of arabinose operon
MNIQKLSPETFLESILATNTEIQIKTAGITTINSLWQIAERIVPDHLLYYLENGSMEASLNKNNFKLKAGNLLWVQPGVSQKFWLSPNTPESKVYFARFHLKTENQYLALETNYLIMDDFFHLQNHFYDFLIQQSEPSFYSKYLQKASIAIIFCDVLKEPQKKDVVNEGLKRYQIIHIQKFIHKNIHKRFTSAELAKEVKMNQDYFSRQFKKSFKQTPKEYLKQERIRRAANLLMESNMNISELSRFLGYTDVYQFSQQFKKIYHISPNNYRKSPK